MTLFNVVRVVQPRIGVLAAQHRAEQHPFVVPSYSIQPPPAPPPPSPAFLCIFDGVFSYCCAVMTFLCAGLDSESIWSELELRNMPLEKHTKKTLARLLQSEDMSVRAVRRFPVGNRIYDIPSWCWNDADRVLTEYLYCCFRASSPVLWFWGTVW